MYAGHRLLENYVHTVGGSASVRPATGCRMPGREKTGIDLVMRQLGLFPGLHLYNVAALLNPEFTRSRIAAGPKYIVLHGSSGNGRPWLKTHWGAYGLALALKHGCFLYLPEEFIEENK